jgi:hypothetical protein
MVMFLSEYCYPFSLYGAVTVHPIDSHSLCVALPQETVAPATQATSYTRMA